MLETSPAGAARETTSGNCIFL